MCYGPSNRKSRMGNSSPNPFIGAKQEISSIAPSQLSANIPSYSAPQASTTDNNWIYNLSDQLDLYPVLVDMAPQKPAAVSSAQQFQPQNNTEAIQNWLAGIEKANEDTKSFSSAFQTDEDLLKSVSPPPASVYSGVSSYNCIQSNVVPIAPLAVNKDTILPVMPEDVSKAQLKRMKNTEAARQSRKRKVEHMKQLEMQVEQLDSKNKDLERDNAVLRSENSSYLRRVEALERQVEELHSVLFAFGARSAKNVEESIAKRIRME